MGNSNTKITDVNVIIKYPNEQLLDFIENHDGGLYEEFKVINTHGKVAYETTLLRHLLLCRDTEKCLYLMNNVSHAPQYISLSLCLQDGYENIFNYAIRCNNYVIIDYLLNNYKTQVIENLHSIELVANSLENEYVDQYIKMMKYIALRLLENNQDVKAKFMRSSYQMYVNLVHTNNLYYFEKVLELLKELELTHNLKENDKLLNHLRNLKYIDKISVAQDVLEERPPAYVDDTNTLFQKTNLITSAIESV